jgi:hypothetical protein
LNPLRILVTALVLAAPVCSQAELLGNAKKGYAFELPHEWRMANPDFVLEAPNGASITEIELPPEGERSLDQVSYAATMMAGMRAGYQVTSDRFDLNGQDWQGRVTVFVEPKRYGMMPRHVLQLVARVQQQYRLFYLAIPSREWESNREPIKKLLGGFRTLHSS